jgi:hypothetical protein
MVVKHGLCRAAFPHIGVVKHQLTDSREKAVVETETFSDKVRE